MTKGFSLALLAALACSTPMSGAHAAYIIGNLDGNDGTDSPNLTGGRTHRPWDSPWRPGTIIS
jgi:hypothetical protein